MGWMLMMLMALPGQVMERQTEKLPVQAWVGEWRLGEDSRTFLKITREGSDIVVEGEAIWQGYGDNIHEGAFHGRARAGTRQLLVDDRDMPGDCQLTMLRLGDELIAVDPGQSSCGGVNVSFSGTYRRR